MPEPAPTTGQSSTELAWLAWLVRRLPAPLAGLYERLGPQAIKFGLVGVLHNAGAYLLYLLLTWAGLHPKLAMSLLYLTGTLISFLANRRWSFRFGGAIGPALIRYFSAYAAGYLANLGALLVFVDRLDLPHQAVMAVMTVVLAISLFLLMRHWVFPHRESTV